MNVMLYGVSNKAIILFKNMSFLSFKYKLETSFK